MQFRFYPAVSDRVAGRRYRGQVRGASRNLTEDPRRAPNPDREIAR